MDGDRRHIDADLVHARRLPVGLQSALLLVPQRAAQQTFTTDVDRTSPELLYAT